MGIQVNNINFDTTSKVMWGQYETLEGAMGVIQMDFGHSKDKREDKKQIKFGIGCANGLVVDAVVLSGNKDDKTYNTDTLKTTKETTVNKAREKETELISRFQRPFPNASLLAKKMRIEKWRIVLTSGGIIIVRQSGGRTAR